MPHTAIPPRALVLLAVLTLVWGTTWPLFPYAVREVSVWTFRLIAVLLAGSALLVTARLRGWPLAVPREHWGTLVAASMGYLVVFNIGSTYAAVLIPSGQAAILGFTMPLWMALIGWLLLDERMTPRMAAAILLGALAVLLLMAPAVDAYLSAPLGFAVGLLAGLGWAVGTLIIKRRPIPVPSLVLAGWQLLIAAPPTALGAIAFGDGEWVQPSWQSLVIIGYIALVPMSIGNVAWFAIVGMLPANVAGLSSILVPVVAMISGAIVHGEPLGPLQWAAMACCVGGLSLALMKPPAAS